MRNDAHDAVRGHGLNVNLEGDTGKLASEKRGWGRDKTVRLWDQGTTRDCMREGLWDQGSTRP
jgi:hypothetical protein